MPTSPEEYEVARRFAQALVANQFAEAHEMLASSMKATVDVDALRADYEQMLEIYDGERPTGVEVMTSAALGLDPQNDPPGHVYVAICGDTFGEGVRVKVAREGGGWVIAEFELGRP
jgi:hypothetical protein